MFESPRDIALVASYGRLDLILLSCWEWQGRKTLGSTIVLNPLENFRACSA